MSILRSSGSKRITLGLALVGAIALAGCEGSGSGPAEVTEVKDGAKGKAQKAAREAAYGPTGSAPTGKNAAPKVEAKKTP